MRSFSLHFSGTSWAQIGALDAASFDQLQRTLERFAEWAAEQLAAGATPRVDECVPITAGGVVAECTFDDFRRSITVLLIERWDSSSRAA